jgi:phosphoglycerol transferase
MEAALPEGGMVFQLPVMDFPEAPLPGIPSYDHFRPYLYSSQLRFSFGSMKGRERERWQHEVQQLLVEGATVDQGAKQIRFKPANVRRAVDELEKRGFQALYLNRNAFPDRGRGLEDALLEIGYDVPPIRSAVGDLTCIVLRKR